MGAGGVRPVERTRDFRSRLWWPHRREALAGRYEMTGSQMQPNHGIGSGGDTHERVPPHELQISAASGPDHATAIIHPHRHLR
jgi:hypothetical protein